MYWTADPVFRLDVLRELDLFWVLPRQQQVQLALWAGNLGYKLFNCSSIDKKQFFFLPGWLFRLSRLVAHSVSGLVVLFLQVCRPARHLLLCGKVGIQCSLWKIDSQYIFRKKYSHVSALHVIHHSTLPWLSWWGPKWVLTFEIKSQRSHSWWGPKWVLPSNSQSQAQRSSEQLW